MPIGGHPRPAARGVRTALAALTVFALSAALAPPAPAAGSLFGVVPQNGAAPAGDRLDLLQRAGVTKIRLLMDWRAIERSPGEFNWRATDAMIRATTARGMRPMITLYGTPAWASPTGAACVGPPCYAVAPTSRHARIAFANFASEAARRYGRSGDFWEERGPFLPGQAPAGEPPRADPPAEDPPPSDPPAEDPPPAEPPAEEPPLGEPPPEEECMVPLLCESSVATRVAAAGSAPCECSEALPVRAWEVWNEPNSPSFWPSRVNVRNYAKLLKRTSEGLRSEDPRARVVLAGMWGPGSARRVVLPVVDFLRRLYRIKGTRRAFDGIAIHPYSKDADGVLRQLRSARSAARRFGDRRVAIWVTEIGWASDGPAKEPYVKGRRGQARLLRRSLPALERKRHRLRLRGVYWYSFQDLPGGEALCSWCGYAGLRRLDGSPKPAWRAFVNLVR